MRTQSERSAGSARGQGVVGIGVNRKRLLTPERKMLTFTSFKKVTMSENYLFF